MRRKREPPASRVRHVGRPLAEIIPDGNPAWAVVTRALRGVECMSALPADVLERAAAAMDLVEFRAEAVPRPRPHRPQPFARTAAPGI